MFNSDAGQQEEMNTASLLLEVELLLLLMCFYIYFKPSYGSDGKESACNVGDPGSIPGLADPLEKEMAVHSRILAWKIPWMEEPVRLQSMESQRVKHD